MFTTLRSVSAVLAGLILLIWPLAIAAQEAATPAQAETPPAYVLTNSGAPDYAAWTKLADRVEQAIEVGRASDKVLSDLRGDLTDWRTLFSEYQAENSIRINTLKTQLSTLGPEPETPGSEPAVLTQRRAELTRNLNAAQLPVQEADEAFSRADVLIREIDTLLRSRQTDALFKLGPTPLNPILWGSALSDLKTTLDLAGTEVTQAWGSDAQRKDLQADLPLTLILLAVALVLLTRSRNWIIRLGNYVRERRTGPSRGVVGFLMSLGQVIAPVVGIFALIMALDLTGVLGLRGQVLAASLGGLGLIFFVALWIGTRLFSAEAGAAQILPTAKPAIRAEARLNTAFLGLLAGLSSVLNAIAEHEKYSSDTVAVLSFPIFLATGFLLVRLGRILRRNSGPVTAGSPGAFRARMAALIGRACEIVGFAGPVMAAIGYHSLAVASLFPTVLTLGLIAVIELLYGFITNLYGTLLRKDEESTQQALLPVLAGLVLVLASVPIFALIWGARATDISEVWATFLQGFQMGEARITPRSFMVFAIIFGIGYAATRGLQLALRATILPKTRMDKGGQNAIAVGTGYLGIFLAAVAAITAAGIDLSSIAIIAGALSVGIGFGLQTIVSNFVSGIILLIERPISEGDWIEVGGQMGYVRDISVRSTRIETFDRTDVILPNSDLVSGVVTNFTRGNSIGRVIIPVGVAYGTDTRKIETILCEIAEGHPLVTVNPPPSVVFQGFGADSLDFEIRAILSDVNYMLTVKSEINHEIARRFVEEGIEIPFAQRDIWLRNPEALAQTAPNVANAPAQDASGSGSALTRDALTVEDVQNDPEGEGDE